jgi:hypothetical protein
MASVTSPEHSVSPAELLLLLSSLHELLAEESLSVTADTTLDFLLGLTLDFTAGATFDPKFDSDTERVDKAGATLDPNFDSDTEEVEAVRKLDARIGRSGPFRFNLLFFGCLDVAFWIFVLFRRRGCL